MSKKSVEEKKSVKGNKNGLNIWKIPQLHSHNKISVNLE